MGLATQHLVVLLLDFPKVHGCVQEAVYHLENYLISLDLKTFRSIFSYYHVHMRTLNPVLSVSPTAKWLCQQLGSKGRTLLTESSLRPSTEQEVHTC